jgi:hypothetical protein
MVVRKAPRVRIAGGGKRLRLRTVGDWESYPLDALRECRGVATALEKALWQTVHQARDAGHSWAEIGAALGVTKQTAWQRFTGDIRHPLSGERMNRKPRERMHEREAPRTDTQDR